MEPGEVVADRFVLDRTAGSGAMGVVLRARDRRTGEAVALKFARIESKDVSERFEREVEALSALRHPNVVRYVAHGNHRGIPYFAMELLEGETLSERLMRSRLTVAEASAVLFHAASGLSAAHRAGIVHRDIKPSNLFLVQGEVDALKVIDFGVVLLPAAQRFEQPGQLVGTPGYMSPEQARGVDEVDPSSDVFALGSVIWRALTGHPPFPGRDVLTVLAKIVVAEPERLASLVPDVLPGFDALVHRMMAKQPAKRQANGGVVIEELAALDEATIRPRSIPPRAAAPKLGEQEQAVVSVVLCPRGTSREAAKVREVVGEHGASIEVIADGSMLVVFHGRGAASDLAARAARCALSIRARLPKAPLVLATGRALVSSPAAAGEAIARAVDRLRPTSSREPTSERMVEVLEESFESTLERAVPILLDDPSAHLLESAFEVRDGRRGAELSAERVQGASARTLLGRPTPFIGREEELAHLLAAHRGSVETNRAKAALVIGEPGIGKSRLRQELSRRIEQDTPKAELWLSRCEPMRAQSPYGAASAWVRSAAGLFDGEPLDRARAKLHERVAQSVAEPDLDRVASLLGELAGVPFRDTDRPLLRAVRSDAALRRDQLEAAFVALLDAECAMGPLVLLLEDAHWADAASLELLDGTLRLLSGKPLFVIVLARPSLLEAHPGLLREHDILRVPLRGLSSVSSTRLVRAALGESVDDGATARLVERAAGNAFYLEELIRAAAEGKSETVPSTVIAMVQARLSTLPSSTRRVLRLASVFGATFWAGGVRALGEQEHVEGELQTLVQEEVIARRWRARFPHEEEWTFRHALLREAAYAMLTPEDQQAAHRLAALWLERSGEREAMVLADHLRLGGEAENAAQWYLRAAERALLAGDLRGALARADQAVGCGAKGELLGRCRAVQCEAHRWRAEIDAVIDRGKAALELLPAGSQAWCATVGELAPAFGNQGRFEQAAVIAELACAVEPREDARAAYVRGMLRIALGFVFWGLPDRARAAYERAEQAAADLLERDLPVSARVYQARAILARRRGDPGEQLRWNERSLSSFERAGDARSACVQRGNLAEAWRDVGLLPQAEQAAREALAVAQSMGLHTVEPFLRSVLGATLARRGSLEEARQQLQRAVDLIGSMRDLRGEVVARAHLADVLVLCGDVSGASREAETALALAEDMPSSKAHALATCARIALMHGRAAEAVELARSAARAIETLGYAEEGDARVRVVLAEALHAAHQEDEARSCIRAALDSLMARAEKIEDEGLRRRFLTHVPAHARTIALVDSWEGVEDSLRG